MTLNDASKQGIDFDRQQLIWRLTRGVIYGRRDKLEAAINRKLAYWVPDPAFDSVELPTCYVAYSDKSKVRYAILKQAEGQEPPKPITL